MTNGGESTQIGYTGQRDESHPEREGVGHCEVLSPYSEQRFKTYHMFIPGTFHLIFLDHNGPPVTETMESETSDKVGGLLKHAVTLEKLGNTDKQEEKKFQHSINIWYTYSTPKPI